MQLAINEFDWMAAVQTWIAVVLLLSFAGFVLGGLLAATARGSLVEGYIAAASRSIGLVRDVVAFSPRRLWAITWHSMLESIRRRMLLAVLAVFVVFFLFAGWYLSSRPTEQVKVYVSFVMMAATLIAMIASGLLACMSLPGDIKDMTIHTVVTKPVRRLEIVLGRTLGLTIVATAILAVMGSMSYIYLTRSVNSTLESLRQELADATQKADVKRVAEIKDSIDQIESKLVARVPVYAHTLTGPEISVGQETTYRKYIEGNKAAAAIWHFSNLPVSRLMATNPPAIPLEMTFTVFRTTKGEIGHGVIAQLTFKNPKTGFQIVGYPFEIREYYVNRQTLAESPEKSLSNLIQGSDGELDIEVRCLSGSQYLGMARPDLYILLDKASFGINFFKGVVGVWLRVLLIICVAVMFSTFLSTFVAMLATAGVFAGGICMNYLRELATGKAPGGGPLEAMMRIITHENLERPLDPGFWTSLSTGTDHILRFVVSGLTFVLPDLGFFNTAPLVANGFDITVPMLLQTTIAALAYALPFSIVGYFLLQSREIAR